jgi:hypothetical protein
MHWTGPEVSKDVGADGLRKTTMGIPRAERRCRVMDGKLHEGGEGRPIILPLRVEGAEHVGDDSIDAFGLTFRIMMAWRPKDHSGDECSM